MNPFIEAFLATFGVALGLVAFIVLAGFAGRAMDWWRKR